MSDLDYYQIAAEASGKINGHQALLYIQEKAKYSKKILDVGCGEGTRLNTLLPKNKKATGVDISKQAIKKAKGQYPNHKFISLNNETLPFKDSSFDLVYTAFVLEHTKNQTKFLNEMLRVLDNHGELVIICPNYGAPNRRSPNSTESPLQKLLKGFLNDFSLDGSLNWTKVKPKKKYINIDDDTTVEPYLKTLENFFLKNNLRVIRSSSLWGLEPFSLNPRKLLFSFLGKLNVSPFKYWGPQLFIVVNKK